MQQRRDARQGRTLSAFVLAFSVVALFALAAVHGPSSPSVTLASADKAAQEQTPTTCGGKPACEPPTTACDPIYGCNTTTTTAKDRELALSIKLDPGYSKRYPGKVKYVGKLCNLVPGSGDPFAVKYAGPAADTGGSFGAHGGEVDGVERGDGCGNPTTQNTSGNDYNLEFVFVKDPRGKKLCATSPGYRTRCVEIPRSDTYEPGTFDAKQASASASGSDGTVRYLLLGGVVALALVALVLGPRRLSRRSATSVRRL